MVSKLSSSGQELPPVVDEEGGLITITGPGGKIERVTRAQLDQEWLLIRQAREFLQSINPIGRWMKRGDSSSDDITEN